MTTASIAYGTSTSLTWSIASLATSANLDTGRESTAVDNTSTLATDYMVSGRVTTGSSPTAARQIEIWAGASEDGSRYSGGLTGSDAAVTSTTEKSQMKCVCVIFTDATSSHQYEWGPYSIAQLFGGVVPRKWNLFMTHNTGVNLSASNQVYTYTAVNYTSA